MKQFYINIVYCSVKKVSGLCIIHVILLYRHFWLRFPQLLNTKVPHSLVILADRIILGFYLLEFLVRCSPPKSKGGGSRT